MLRATLKSLLSHKRRLFTTSLAVLLGVAFMAGTFVLTDTMGRTFDDLFSDVSANTDAVVRSADTVEVPFGGEQRGRLPEDIVESVRDVPGVAIVEPEIEDYAQFVDEEGEPVGNPAMGAPTFGLVWPQADELNPMNLVDGRPPETSGEVVADKQTADTGGFEVGDTITLITRAGPTELELVGIARFGQVDSPGGASLAMLTYDDAQRLLLDGAPELTSLSVVAEDGVSQEQVVEQLAAALPDDVEVITGAEFIEENQDAIAEALGFFQTTLLVFALIALFVSCFIIYNTFSIIVAQRTRELALLRAIGASRRQVLGSVLLEALAVGMFAAIIGLLAGIGLAQLLQALLGALGIDIPSSGIVLLGRTIVVSVLVGVGITVISAIFPARRAARVPPVAALREVATDKSGTSARRIVAGAVVLVLGAVLLLTGLTGDGGNPALTVGIAVAIIFIGVAVLSPVLARPVTSVLGWPVARTRGTVGLLARENTLRSPSRTAGTAAALMIGVGLVSFIAIFAQSAKAVVNNIVDEAFLGDFVVQTANIPGQGGLPGEVANQIDALPEVDVAAGLRGGYANVAGEGRFVQGIDPEAGLELFDIGILAGEPLDLGPDGLAVHDDFAADNGWDLGTVVPASFLGSGDADLEVRLIYSENQLAGNMFMSIEAFEANFDVSTDTTVAIRVADGVDSDAARAAIESILEPHATAELLDLQEFKDAQAAQINALLNVIYALLALAIIIALIGIANTLALSIFERTREIGLLRAVGMTRRQVRSTVRWESVLIALFGTSLGLVLGLFFGWAMVQALESEGFDQYSVPGGQLVLIVLVAAFAGVIAAALPARRAARLDVLEAIATE